MLVAGQSENSSSPADETQEILGGELLLGIMLDDMHVRDPM